MQFVARKEVESGFRRRGRGDKHAKNRPPYLKATLSPKFLPPFPLPPSSCRGQDGACYRAEPPPRNVYIMLTNKWSR